MREIVVISGKGGTGKTSVCASLAHLAQNKVVCDLDVDAPDMHILLDPQVHTREAFVSGNEAVIDRDACRRCGICFEHCRFDAVKKDGDVYGFERVAALCDHFRIPVAVLINKADLNHEEVQAITRLADDKGYTVVGALPFDPAVTGAMIRRKALTETDSPLASTLSAIWGRIRELAYAPRKRG